MKRILSLLLFCGVLVIPGRAQSIQRATDSFNEFVNLNNSGGDKVRMYDALYNAYSEYADIVNTFSLSSPPYAESKAKLRLIRPYLQNGAAFKSNARKHEEAVKFARAYVDIPMLECFTDEHFENDKYYPTMVYFAASGTYNAKDFESAVRYLKEYLDTKAKEKQKDVYFFLAKALTSLHRLSEAKSVLREAVAVYPDDFNLISMAINNCIDTGDNASLVDYAGKGLAVRPGNEQLLNFQGKAYEELGEYESAINVYKTLCSINPNSLMFTKHLAVNTFNQGVYYNNKALLEKDKTFAGKYEKNASECFETASGLLQNVLTYDPTAVNYLEALAATYQFTGKADELMAVNERIVSLGGSSVTTSTMPVMMKFESKVAAPLSSVVASNDSISKKSYSEYAKLYVEERIKLWQNKDQYETLAEYQDRVTEESRNAKVKELLSEAEESYLKVHARNIQINNVSLKPYDADNEVFLAESEYGQMIIPVPRANNEAKTFESSWEGIQFKDPKFHIRNDKIEIASMTFVTPMGRSYRYDGEDNLGYNQTVVNVEFDDIDYAKYGGVSRSSESRVKKTEVNLLGQSDVDKDIPHTSFENKNTFAFIIANEDYKSVARVPMAINDGAAFKEYCLQTLGMPQTNVRFYENATYGVMLSAVSDITEISKAYSNDDIQLIFYYAGHGIPDESTKDAYLLPVDSDGRQIQGCYSLRKLYEELGALRAKPVLVLLDACFSGAERSGGMIASARGVALRSKEEDALGNMVVISAASGDETAFPYQEKGHGLFTYFLLKKLQETSGKASLDEIYQYVSTNVKQHSVLINHKPQTPTVKVSASMAECWKQISLVQ